LLNNRTIGFIVALSLIGFAVVSGEASSVSVRKFLSSLPVTEKLGGDTTRPVEAQNAFSFQAANAAGKHQRPFSFGNRLFNTNWVEAPASVKSFDGLGPMFNRVSCSGCHTKDGRGQPPETGSGPMDSMLLRISIPGLGPHGGPNPVPNYGDQLSERSIKDVPPEGQATISYVEVKGQYADGESFSLRKPSYKIANAAYGALPKDVLISPRVAPQMIGLGLLDAVPEETLRGLSDSDDADNDGISGRMNEVWDSVRSKLAVGRFGWKAGQPDLINQNSAAANGDIGITSRFHVDENCAETQSACAASIKSEDFDLNDEFLEKLTLYTSTLAVPAQRHFDDPQIVQGSRIFRDMGCAACHMPTLQSGPHPLPEITNQTFHPYTDLLLHDMGQGLSDNRPDFTASGSEWRTPPLWGLGLVPKVNGHQFLLHDGRARGFAEAILWHQGEAAKSAQRFKAAPKADRDAIVAFLNSL
jgi:CxxC motif-containing protein (DUF1111 family)